MMSCILTYLIPIRVHKILLLSVELFISPKSYVHLLIFQLQQQNSYMQLSKASSIGDLITGYTHLTNETVSLPTENDDYFFLVKHTANHFFLFPTAVLCCYRAIDSACLK